MCGLFGIANFTSLDMSIALSALNRVEHRGPDQHDHWSSDKIFIGHQRLSILDLSEHGRQPMSDHGVVISVNGEIYNFIQLKNELSKKYDFKSDSDSEIVLYGYIEWGIDELLTRIDGMYAITIYDQNKEKLFLVRDRVGIKPLYYSLINNEIAWASELKSIEEYYKKYEFEKDKTALYDFLTYMYIPAPKTMYKDVFKLEPAHYGAFDLSSGSFETTRYWQLRTEVKDISLTSAKEQLRSLIKESVKEQMISDVPVGFFLSGGMDSSTVVAVASELSDKINTYSIGFDDKKHDETRYADAVASSFDTNHHKKILDSETTKDMFSLLKKWYDEPFGDTSAFPTYIVSKFAKEGSTVVLTGDGGDEVFGGYHWYSKFLAYRTSPINKYINFLKPLVFKVKEKLNHGLLKRVLERVHRQYLLSDLELYTKLLGGLTKEEKSDYAKKWNIPNGYDEYWHFRKFYKKELPILTRLQYLDFHTYLPGDILTKVDRVSMDVSLECRVPLLSKKLIEFSFSLPESVRYAEGELKGILKESYRGVLSNEIIDREKKGFSIPIASWKDNIFDENLNRQENILKEFIEL